jgi:hypothetical protein
VRLKQKFSAIELVIDGRFREPDRPSFPSSETFICWEEKKKNRDDFHKNEEKDHSWQSVITEMNENILPCSRVLALTS